MCTENALCGTQCVPKMRSIVPDAYLKTFYGIQSEPETPSIVPDGYPRRLLGWPMGTKGAFFNAEWVPNG